ncbi:uncharacterized mitochondrial protein-like protein [Tanacetum coccineum]|uniref:Uncharacterized mitochondrial protein-like protein n=1 Tax=Tanacetum coccineum TaxID=301880 RepID=A0ABQ4WJ39_9ASTR
MPIMRLVLECLKGEVTYHGQVDSELMNDLKQNKIELPIVTINAKFLKNMRNLSLLLERKDYDDEHQGETFQNDLEDPLTSAMMLLAHAITLCYSTPTNNRLRSSSNTRNQVVMKPVKVNIQSKNVGNDGRITRRSYNVQEESVEGSNVQKETRNVQRNLQTSSNGHVTNVQCYNCSEKGHYARNYRKPRVWDSKYFTEQMLLAKKDEVRVILSNEQNGFLLADDVQIEELKELSANICMMAIIQPANIDSDEGPSYDSAFISEVQKPSTSYMNPLFRDSNHEQTYHEQPKIINSTIGDDQTNSDIIFDDPHV